MVVVPQYQLILLQYWLILKHHCLALQVDLTEPILSRFDILCVVKDTVDPIQVGVRLTLETYCFYEVLVAVRVVAS